MKAFSACLLLTLSGLAFAAPDLHTEEITYTADGQRMQGYLAYDKSVKGKRPGVLVVHEWWGHNEYARQRARMLAELGYTALAVDMYGDGKQAQHPDEAGKFAGQVRQNLDVAKARFTAALEALRKHPTTDKDEMAAIGYCFGGSVVLEMANLGVDLDAVASFHGALKLNAPPKPGKVKPAILVMTGGQDKMVPSEQVEQLRQDLRKAQADFTIIVYPEAMHSFTNPEADKFAAKFNLPLAYDAEADRHSWDAMRAFFTGVFAD